MTSFFKIFAAFVAAASLVASHGAPVTDTVLKARAAAVDESIGLLKKCEHVLMKREHVEKRLAKRKEFIDRHLRLRKRNLEGPEFSPNPNLHKREHALNPRQAVACVLAPEVDTGPYYLNSQLIREDIREGQVGVPLLLDAQVIDVNTCKPIPNIYVDFWSCNSTGTYSGFAAENTLGLTHLRGIGITDEDGIVQITTIFPGWYSGRATHIHIATHHNAVANANTHTISGGTVSHVGQIFFEEKYLTQVDTLAPYNRNTLRRVRNAEDIYVTQAQANGYNSVATSVLLGSALKDGLVSSFSVAVNPKIDYTNGLNSPVRQPGVPVGGGSPTNPGQPTQPAGGNLQKYAQCGGQGWNGSGTCVSGSRCVKLNDWYSQCQ